MPHHHGFTDRIKIYRFATHMLVIVALIQTGFLVSGSIPSASLVGDTWHAWTDALGLAAAWVALAYHNGKWERRGAVVSFFLLLAGILHTGFDGFERFLDPVPLPGLPMLAIAALGLFVNGALFRTLHTFTGHGSEGALHQASVVHLLGDFLGSACVLAVAIIRLAIPHPPVWLTRLDGALGMGLALWLAIVAIGILRAIRQDEGELEHAGCGHGHHHHH